MSHQLSRDEAMDVIDELQTQVAILESRCDSLAETTERLEDDLRAAEAEKQQLRSRVADLESIVEPDPAATDYQDKSRGEKVRELRETLARKATKNDGKAQMDWNEAMAAFDQHPSRGHIYDLMDEASNLDGFEYGTFHDKKRLRVDLDGVNDETVLHAVNTPDGDEGAI